MPLRTARLSDLPRLTDILVDAYTDDNMYQNLYPNWTAHPKEVWRGFHEKVLESFWDYRCRIVVSCKEMKGTEIIDGVAIWERSGPGWESVWGISAWDPRTRISQWVQQYHSFRRYLLPNLAALQPSVADPDPVTHVNIKKAIIPFAWRLWSAPHRQSNWQLGTLAVPPEYQGRGVGTDLTVEGLERAAREKLPCVCIAKDGKEGWYQKRGFTKLEGFVTAGPDNPLPKRGIRGGAVLWTW